MSVGTAVIDSPCNGIKTTEEEEDDRTKMSALSPSVRDRSSDDDNSLLRLLDDAKKEFHSRRFLKMKQLPSDVTEQGIRQLLHPYDIKDVQLNRVSETAKVTLVTPECLEAWPSETTYVLNHQHVPVTPSNTEGMLCVAHLPFAFTDLDFRNLVQLFGRVSRCFLMRAGKTGESKGYGFVEYSSKDVAYQAKGLLDKKTVGDSVLHCNWLDSSHVTYRSLHSKCLYVDRLPPEYRNLVEFRKLFGSVVGPTYCQIAMWNGRPLGFGLVEFDTPEDAEEIQCLMNNYRLEDHKIRVTFCIPGYRAMVIYNKLTAVKSVATGAKAPLLPNPPVDLTAFNNQLQALVAQNPHVGQALQSLTDGQFSMDLASLTAFNNGAGKGSCSPTANQWPQCGQNLQGCNPSSNSNISAALVLLLATQLQSQLGVQHPSLLGNPELLTLIQNVLRQQESTQKCQQQSPAVPPSPGSNGSKDRTSFSWNPGEASIAQPSGFHNAVCSKVVSPRSRTVYKVPLLPDPPAGKTKVGLLPRRNCFSLSAGVTTPVSPCALSGSQSSTQDGTNQLVDSKNQNTRAPLFLSSSSSTGPAKIPLLGDKPSFVPPVRNESLGPDALKQLLPLLMRQLQQASSPAAVQAAVRPVPSNFIFVSPDSQSSSTVAAAAALVQQQQQQMQNASGASFMHLMLQMASCMNGRGIGYSVGDTSVARQPKNLFLPQQQLSNPFLGSYSPSPFVAAPSEVAKFPILPSNGGGVLSALLGPLSPAKKLVLPSQGFVATTPCGLPVLPASPVVVSKLMADIQQRGSVLGDFWQVPRGTAFKPELNSCLKRRLHVVLPSAEAGHLKRRRF